MKSRTTPTVRVLTVTDMHQRKALFRDLSRAVEMHKPDVVAIIGDALEAFQPHTIDHLLAVECAAQLASLPVGHVVFIRGNHEDINWGEFVCAWPYSRRPLIALYGTAYSVGPLTILRFPCHTGSEFVWCRHLDAQSDRMKPAPDHDRLELPEDHDQWLPQLLRQTGPAGRTLWLMHEPPLVSPLEMENSDNREWQLAIERFRPLLTVAGHHHRPKTWHAMLNGTVCINVGQDENTLRFCVLEFYFASEQSALPTKIEVVAHPMLRRLQVCPR
jgi:Icc-related predicted phosphoesterase